MTSNNIINKIHELSLRLALGDKDDPVVDMFDEIFDILIFILSFGYFCLIPSKTHVHL